MTGWGRFGAGSEQHCSNGPAPATTRTVGRGLLSPFPPPHFRLISPTHQHWGQGARLKALVGAQPAESPEGHDAVLPGPGVAGKRLHVLTEYDQQGSHCSSPGSDHALATHRPRRWGFEQLRDVRGPTRQETPARIAGEARFFRPPTHPVSSGIGGGLERAASSTAATGQHRLPHGLWGAGCCRPSRPRTFD